jgi:hypothetical protein
MARWYPWINAWREQDCVLCEGTFRYRVRQRVAGEGKDNARAESHARRRCNWEWQALLAMRPCPGCGCIQPDVISRTRLRVHRWAFVAVLLFPALANGLSATFGVLSAFLFVMALAALVWAANFATLLWRPNRRLDANLRKARSFQEAGELEAVEPPAAERKEATGWLLHGTDRTQMLALGASLLLLPVIPAPYLLLVVLGWPIPLDERGFMLPALCGIGAFYSPLIRVWVGAGKYGDLASPARLRPLDEAPLEEEAAPPPTDAIRPAPKRPGKSRKIRPREDD